MLKFALSSVLFCAVACGKGDVIPDPTLINGTPADPKEWPASVYASMGNASCSATVVGPSALLIASHCVSDGAQAKFSAGANQYTGRCTHAPGYPSNSTADWTLCKVDRVVSGIAYESILTDAKMIQKGKAVQLTGYGCIRLGGGGGNDGVFRTGIANVTDLPSGRSYDTVTRGGAALCYGDSGGAAYVWDAAKKDRFILAVNSRGNISDTSYLSSTYVVPFQEFAHDWMVKNAEKICGLDPKTVGCRNQPVAPKTEFDFDSAVAMGHVKMKVGKEAALERVRTAIAEALSSIQAWF